MSAVFLQRCAVLLTLCMVMQVGVPWHTVHAASSAEVSASSGGCHPQPSASDEQEEAPLLNTVCEWICAQVQPLMASHGLLLLKQRAVFDAPHAMALSPLRSESVPLPPPILS